MTRTLTALATAATVAMAAMAAPTTADARGGRIAAGIIGGLAAEAIFGGALAASPYYYGDGRCISAAGHTTTGPTTRPHHTGPTAMAVCGANGFGTATAGKFAGCASASDQIS